MYYPSLDLYLKLYDEGERAFAFHAETASAYDAWKQALRARLRDISGVDRCIPCAPEPAMGENVMPFLSVWNIYPILHFWKVLGILISFNMHFMSIK